MEPACDGDKGTKAYNDGTQVRAGSEVAVVQYDGMGRRIKKEVKGTADLDCTYQFYHDGQRTIETRNGSDQMIKHDLWGLEYIDELVAININADPSANATTTDVDDHAYYALHDANYNVLAVVDDEGTLVERYEYTPYGERTVYISSGDNDPDCYSPVYMSQQIPDTTQSPTVPNPYGICEIGHQGLMHDEELGLIDNMARMLHPKLGRFMQRDPLGQNIRLETNENPINEEFSLIFFDIEDPFAQYADGANLYQYTRSEPSNLLDPRGTLTLKEASPCLTVALVSPCVARTRFAVGHYIVVGSSLGGVGGRRSLMASARRTWRARELPGVTPVRRCPPTRKST